MKAEIVIATEEHIIEVANKARPEDKAELWAATMSTPIVTLRRGLEHSDTAYAGLLDGMAVCVWGVAPVCLLTGLGAPWMVGTSDLDIHATKFLRRCRAPLLELFSGYDRLENYVDARNTKAIRWLKFMGFTINNDPQPYGMFSLPFYKFWKEV